MRSLRRCGIPTIRFVLNDDVRVVEADRVMSDSQVFVAERREAGRWLRVVTFPRANVRAVERQVRRPAGESWLVEDVRATAGLSPAAGVMNEAIS